MDKKRANEIVKFLTDSLIESGMNVYKVVLFGSYCNGKPHNDSDIDIAIVSDDFIGKTIFQRAELAGDAVWDTIKKYKVALDVIKLTVDEYENE